MKKIITISMLLIAGLSSAQTSKELQYAGYLNASKTMWEKAIVIAEKESGENSFEMAMAMYGLLNNTMATQDKATFDDNVDQTVDLLKSIIKENPGHAEANAVLSSVYGLVMAYSPMKGMLYGMKSSSLMDEAMRLAPDSPLVQKLHGGSKLYTPEMFGGDAKQAVAAFEKAIELFETGETEENWLYMDTHMGLAMAYNKVEEREKAEAILEKAIAMEPQYHWAKATLTQFKKL
ncbi:tetratricopeptide repeat protein [Ekhidna sp. To15]|uniref:tetratricopeptide repeat protein n=1 Tax=Ekhidna sp. To15 TaxID=3395267 RepID=UPI003F52174B